MPLPLLLAQSTHDAEAAAAGLAGLGCFAVVILVLLGLGLFAFSIYCWWRIFSKAGYSGAMALLMLIPGIGALVMVLVLAFGDWPALKDRNRP